MNDVEIVDYGDVVTLDPKNYTADSWIRENVRPLHSWGTGFVVKKTKLNHLYRIMKKDNVVYALVERVNA